MTRWIVPPVRRTVQVISLVLMVALPLLALYTHYKSAHAIGDLPEKQWRTIVLTNIDDAIGENEARRRWVDQTQGTFWSARIAGVELSDPLAGAEAIASSWTFSDKKLLFWSLLIPIAATVLLGRVFCGWICPMNTVLELVDKCRRLLRLAEIRERDVKFSLSNKYVVLVIVLAFAALTQRPFLAMVYPPAVISREVHLFVFESTIGIGLFLLLAICAFELLVSRRWWCRYICPGGALYSLLGRFRLLRVRRDAGKCVECGDCVRVCQFDLKPMLVRTTGMECTNCASCISSCQSKALHYSLVLPLPTGLSGGPTANPNDRQHDRDDDMQTPESDSERHEPVENATPPTAESVAAVAKAVRATIICVACFTCCATTAHAHHILGLPHYSYKENYPQAPTLEYPATTGPYDVLMTSYPGKPVPGEAASVAFYIKNRHTGQPYENSVTVRVLQTFTFGRNKVIHPPATHRPFDNQHKYTVTFPEDGEFVVEMVMDVEGQKEVIPFLVVAGNPTATKSILIAVGVGLVLFLVIVRAIKVKRKRWRERQQQKEPTTPNASSFA